MKYFIRPILLSLIIICNAGNLLAALQQQSVESVFDKIAKRRQNYSFVATVVHSYLLKDILKENFSERIFHDKRGYTFTEIRNFGSDSFHISIERKDTVYFQIPDEDAYRIRIMGSGGSFADSANLKLLQNNYLITMSGTKNYLNRDLLKIKIKSHLNYKPWRVLWINPETGLIYIWEKYSNDVMVYQMKVTDFTYVDNISMDRYSVDGLTIKKSGKKRERFASVEDLKKVWSDPVIELYDLVPGYVLTGTGYFQNSHEEVSLHYSDGLSRLSIFQKKSDGKAEKQVARYNAGRGYYKKQVQDYTISFVGDLTKEKMEEVFEKLTDKFNNIISK